LKKINSIANMGVKMADLKTDLKKVSDEFKKQIPELEETFNSIKELKKTADDLIELLRKLTGALDIPLTDKDHNKLKIYKNSFDELGAYERHYSMVRSSLVTFLVLLSFGVTGFSLKNETSYGILFGLGLIGIAFAFNFEFSNRAYITRKILVEIENRINALFDMSTQNGDDRLAVRIRQYFDGVNSEQKILFFHSRKIFNELRGCLPWFFDPRGWDRFTWVIILVGLPIYVFLFLMYILRWPETLVSWSIELDRIFFNCP